MFSEKKEYYHHLGDSICRDSMFRNLCGTLSKRRQQYFLSVTPQNPGEVTDEAKCEWKINTIATTKVTENN